MSFEIRLIKTYYYYYNYYYYYWYYYYYYYYYYIVLELITFRQLSLYSSVSLHLYFSWPQANTQYVFFLVYSHLFLGVAHADRLAIDYSTGNLYYTAVGESASQSFIGAIHRSLLLHKTVLSNLLSPREIVLYPSKGYAHFYLLYT